jgi:hypothetical protein
MHATQKPLTLVQTPALPIHILFNEFVHGDTFTTALADKVLRMTFMDETISYLEQLTKVKKFLTHHVSLGLGLNVIVINTKESVDDLTMVMMTRYINVCHKGMKPIVINDKVVYLPQSLAHFDSKEILGYVQASVALIKLGNPPVLKPIVIQAPPTQKVNLTKTLPSKPFFPLPTKGQSHSVNLKKTSRTQQVECV